MVISFISRAKKKNFLDESRKKLEKRRNKWRIYYRSSEWLSIDHLNMKPIIILFCILFYLQESSGQDQTNSWSVGVGGGHFDHDVGVMISVGTPYFLNKRFATRITGALRWSEDYHTITQGSAMYPSIRTGIIYLIAKKDNADIYIEGGPNFIFPNKQFSEEQVVIAYYGMLGINFSLYSGTKIGICYFFEMGVTINATSADRIEGEPQYCNGPITNTGFRLLFAKRQ